MGQSQAVGAGPLEADGAGFRLGQYSLLVKLAAGGVANIFLARDENTGNLVAVKVLKPEHAFHSGYARMFLAEAKVAARLEHPNIVPIMGFGQINGVYCLAMEYVFGVTFADLLRRAAKKQKPLSVALVLHVVREIALALNAAHAALDDDGHPLQLVHRDVSPHNILVGFDGIPRLADFGVAKFKDRGWNTTAGIVKGKFGYMSPEQALKKDLDGRSDLFALGIVCWEALTGRYLFRGKTPADVLRAVLDQEIIKPSDAVKGLTPAVDPIVLKALERDPGPRFQDGADMARAIEGLLREAGSNVEAGDIAVELSSLYADVMAERSAQLRAAGAGRPDRAALTRCLSAHAVAPDMFPDPSMPRRPSSLDVDVQDEYDPSEAQTARLPAAPGPGFRSEAETTASRRPDVAALREAAVQEEESARVWDQPDAGEADDEDSDARPTEEPGPRPSAIEDDPFNDEGSGYDELEFEDVTR